VSLILSVLSLFSGQEHAFSVVLAFDITIFAGLWKMDIPCDSYACQLHI
jgi:hypothetical protein